MNIKAYAEEHDATREWNLLNAAQAIIPKMSDAQKRAMFGGPIGEPTRKALRRLGLKERIVFQNTPLGDKVREILQGRIGQ